ncbi:hypothetical protein GW17_00062165 [Ensete ventricosum]|nr:hypothetical protein GW17_00062165 [Ensete ventricosum]RZR77400.1 hypothetical protein BHM03_00002454 [Ensete ventricosum]
MQWDLAESSLGVRQRDREARWEYARRLPEEDRKTQRKNVGGCRIGGIVTAEQRATNLEVEVALLNSELRES